MIPALPPQATGEPGHRPGHPRAADRHDSGKQDFGKHLEPASSKEHRVTEAAGRDAVVEKAVPGKTVAEQSKEETPVIQSEGAGQVPLAPLRAVELQSGAEHAWARIYPQSLHVVGYLSVLGPGQARADGPEGVGGAATAGVPASPADGAAGAAGLEPEQASLGELAAPGPVGEPQRMAETQGRFGTDDMDRAEVVDAPGMADQARWSSQLIRFDAADGTVTLWIRDFRLGDAERRDLAEQVRQHARDAGRPVARVVVNGHEIWREGAASERSSRENQIHGG